MTSLVWGVYARDCYGLSKEEASKLLLKTFDDYGEALEYAHCAGERTAIHLTEDSDCPERSQGGKNRKM